MNLLISKYRPEIIQSIEETLKICGNFTDSEILVFSNSQEAARKMMEQELDNGISYRILLNGLSLYSEIYGRDEWIDNYRNRGIRKLKEIKDSVIVF